jgi:ABC-2 type transport system ATP-binding protein
MAGAELTRRSYASRDREPVDYEVWSGTVPTFDGLPLSVDVTIPCRGDGDGPSAPGPLPSVTMLHGFTDDEHVWEETGKSDTVESTDRPGANSRWNNIWFASRGYATLTYTARGWHDSCGPDTPGGTATSPSPACAGKQYWIHLDDKRWEVRDAQWLTAGLVQSGVADPAHLAITGGSYGGAPTASAALLADHVMCGGDPVPAELGDDPCRGRGDGDLAPWTTPDGATDLTWAAALPLYTFSDLLRVLAPNGRWTDGTGTGPSAGSATEPFGVPLESTVSGLVLAAKVFGTLAPEGSPLDSDILTTTARLLAGPPYDPDDPVVAAALDYERFKSPITTEPQGEVPMFLVQGFTDALFPATEALALVDHVRRSDPDYPVKAFFGDIGHDYAAERQDDWDLVKDQMNEFLDHHLDPKGTPGAPAYDVGASITRCLPVDDEQTYLVADRWGDLSNDRVELDGADVGFEPVRLSTAEAGPSGAATDPISTATLTGPTTYKGCRVVRPAAIDPTTATADFPMEHSATVVGAPTVHLRVATKGSDVPLAVRVWDVEADGSAQALVTRGVYRLAERAPEGTDVTFQLWPQAYRFPAGHRIRVEVTPNDEPYLLANSEEVDVEVRSIELSVPVHREQAPGEGPAAPEPEDDGADSRTALLLGLVAGAALVAIAAVAVRRRRRSPSEVG